MYRDVEATVKAKQRKRFREALKLKKREEAAQEVCHSTSVLPLSKACHVMCLVELLVD
jgi:hypothetical protein